VVHSSSAGLGRWFDVSVAVVVLVAGAPLWAFIALAVRLTSRGPAIYRTVRIGKDGHPFELLKYRSMRIEAGAVITAGADPRITGVGRLLRAAKLDEIPQFINVLRGDMSILGPRPEDPRFIRWTDPVQQQVLSVRPGLTSRASVAYRHEEYLLATATDLERMYRDDILPQKLRLDAEWLAERSISHDVRIIIDTVFAIGSRHDKGRRG
jgi:lipopolysaccharide/colanic/teichoic acid biosynthesis glycosyltransferase